MNIFRNVALRGLWMEIFLNILVLASKVATVAVMSIVQDLFIENNRLWSQLSYFWTTNHKLCANLPYGDGLCCVCGDGNLSCGGLHGNSRKAWRSENIWDNLVIYITRRWWISPLTLAKAGNKKRRTFKTSFFAAPTPTCEKVFLLEFLMTKS